MQSVHDRLIAVLRSGNSALDEDLEGDTSLIKSGKLDSLGLFNLAVFVENEVGCKVDITAYDLAKEWNTIDDILNFIARLRATG